MSKRILTLFCMLFIISTVCMAESNSKGGSDSAHKQQVLQTIKKLEQTQKKLGKDFNKLSDASKADVIKRTSTKNNSDSDSLNDFLEGGLNLNKCNPDSDEDGISDGSEYENGTNPGNDDSDHDGIKDGQEFEARGTIAAISSDSITVATVNYILTGETNYLGDKKQVLTIADFSAGDCVELEGHLQGDSKIVGKIKKDDNCR